jgi:hypothetical protein
LASSLPEGFVERIGNVSDGVLHADIVGSVGIECKQEMRVYNTLQLCYIVTWSKL